MQVGTLLKILHDVVELFNQQGMIQADGAIVFPTDAVKISLLSTEVINILTKNGVPIPPKVNEVATLIGPIVNLVK